MNLAFDGEDAWSVALYGAPSQDTISYLKTQYTNFAQPLNEFGRAFIDRSKQVFEYFSGSNAMAFARSVINSMGTDMVADEIIAFINVAQFQKAMPKMQRWIMAEPSIRTTYHMQQCDGYSRTYHDLEPGKVGEAHYDYRLVMDGIVQFDESDRAHWKIYGDELKEGDTKLSLAEKTIILNTWDTARILHALADDDLTSESGGKL